MNKGLKIVIFAGVGTLAGALLGYLGQCVGNT
ncbi:hypothetical protein AOP6_0731 [Desulfuromonas sp. AOP6]|nr:hypothetical protein AOP6_0731 [Desulfuromonas sp. AOP6]